jgi:hypothetical protein
MEDKRATRSCRPRPIYIRMAKLHRPPPDKDECGDNENDRQRGREMFDSSVHSLLQDDLALGTFH